MGPIAVTVGAINKFSYFFFFWFQKNVKSIETSTYPGSIRSSAEAFDSLDPDNGLGGNVITITVAMLTGHCVMRRHFT